MASDPITCSLLRACVVAATALAAAAHPPRAAAQTAAPPPSYAQNVKDGQALAERLCRSCHVVGNQPASTAEAGIPSFKAIANKPGQTAAHIRGVLIAPHPPMPDVQLSRAEMDRLIAFIDSQRAPSAGPPLVPRTAPAPKPVYPDPS